MSNSLAIAAVTATIQNLLTEKIHEEDALSNAKITAQPPDKARGNNIENQLNIFLYQVGYNAAFRNTPTPRKLKPDETSYPPLPLILYYLITAYGQDNDDVKGHHLLSKAMSVLHDNPIFDRDEIRNSLPGNDLYEQIESVRITPQPISLDEISKLWMIFQTQYRISAAYQVSVILIDSTKDIIAPLPVIKRGDEGDGAKVLAAPSPVLNSIVMPRLASKLIKPSAELVDIVTIVGERLEGDIKVHFINQHVHEKDEALKEVILSPEEEATSQKMVVKIDDDPAKWSAGLYLVCSEIKTIDGDEFITNTLPFMLAPTIIDINPRSVRKGNIDLTLTVKPKVGPNQPVSLIFGRKQISIQDRGSQPTDQLKFSFAINEAGEYLVRLRVDGVDSIPIDLQADEPKFDDNQKVKVRD